MAGLHLFLSDMFHNYFEEKYRIPIKKDSPFAILPSIVGIRYVIGSTYPGKRDDEEFIFYKWEGNANIQCIIYVGKLGKFWISPGSVSSKTFVNLELLEDPTILKDGDNISFGLPRNFDDSKEHPVFLVKLEQLAPVSVPAGIQRPFPISGNHALNNSLVINTVLLSIFKCLRVEDLKNCSLFSKTWNLEASKMLEQRGAAFILQPLPYINPNHSMQIFNYLYRQNPLKIRNLELAFPPPENRRKRFGPGHSRDVIQKMHHDFEKFLSSEHHFTSLSLISPISCLEDYSSFLQVLQALGENLIELNFYCDMTRRPLNLPSSITLPLNNLKKFSDYGDYYGQKESIMKPWFVSIYSNFSNTLEELSIGAGNAFGLTRLEEIVKLNPSKLKRLRILEKSWEDASEFECLFKLEAQLELLVFQVIVFEQDCAEQVSNFLEKHANTLTELQIDLHAGDENTLLYFTLPAFPKLSELKFSFTDSVRVRWNGGELDYGAHFPALRILKLKRRDNIFDEERRNNVNQSENNLFVWEIGGSVFSSFFPIESGIVCRTVHKLTISLLNMEKGVSAEEYRRHHLRLLRITEMFPEVAIKAVEGLGLTDSETYYPNK